MVLTLNRLAARTKADNVAVTRKKDDSRIAGSGKNGTPSVLPGTFSILGRCAWGDWANAAGFSGPNVQLDLTLSTIYPCTTLSPYPARVLPSKEGRLARAIQPLCRQIAEA
jgi:hypothetical protein